MTLPVTDVTLPVTYPNTWNAALLPGAILAPLPVPVPRLMQEAVAAAAVAIRRATDAVNRAANMGPGAPQMQLIAKMQAVANLML